MKLTVFLFAFVGSYLFINSQVVSAQEITREYEFESDIPYRSGNDLSEYDKERCRLDLYAPIGKKNLQTVVWFHGGGLTGGKKSIPKELKEQGIAVVAVNYRLSPKVKVADCIDDAAAAVAWTFKNIEKYGGSKEKIFVSGHSAGGYLTSMIGLDKSWLAKYDIDADDIAGLIPFSGHTITHFTARKEQGIDGKQPLIDELAPLFHVRKDAPPTLLITGDRELEMLGRYEENAYLWRMMQVVGHPNCKLLELDGYNHGKMAGPAHPLLIEFVKKIASAE
ncbi:alpha/beta hydrolase [Planctomicrobium sp.]|jgi:acetyl esterase/lipase|nr:alpha/beta hydrolase [Planctomicrobium sp.]MDB4440021.1 alpha/beta hydrolase [Planctomicrobium sp.]